jgi:hypothetical protein
LLVLMGLAFQRTVPSIRRDLARFRVAEARPTQVPGVIRPGSVVVTELVPPSTLRVGDVIAYDHPLRERNTVYGTVTQIEPVPGTAGYLLRLDVGETNGEPWYAEFFGGARRVVLSMSIPAMWWRP